MRSKESFQRYKLFGVAAKKWEDASFVEKSAYEPQGGVLELQRQHDYLSNSRKDFLNKLAHSLILRYDCLALEDLQIQGMVHNHHLSKSILDAGWGILRQRLADKAAEVGRQVIPVPPSNTSKTCSSCGYCFEDLKLTDRWIDCPNCGLSIDRDVNAAINIKRAGLVRWGISQDNSLKLPQEAPAFKAWGVSQRR